MANREKGESTYTVNGKEYTLVLDSDAMVAMEDAASTPGHPVFFSTVMALAQEGSWKYKRILVWASLRKYHPDITLAEAGDLALRSSIEEMERTMRDLSTSATPDPEDLKELGVKAANPQPAQGTRSKARRRRGTGATSTSSGAASA